VTAIETDVSAVNEARLSNVDFIPNPDPLLRNPHIAHSVDLPVLGLVARFETNSRYVYELTEETFGSWRCLPAHSTYSPPGGLRVRVIVREGSEGVEGHVPVRYFCPDLTREVLQTPASFGITDPIRGEAFAVVTTELAADRGHFRNKVLEALTLGLLSRFDRHPIHASAVGCRGRAVILTGPSGSGKSTLAYAAHTEGFDVLSDDHVWVQVTPALRIWGWPGHILLLPEAASMFPDATDFAPTWDGNGEPKLAYHLDPTGNVHRHVVEGGVVCLVEQGSKRPTLERLTSSAVLDGLTRQLTSGFDLFAHTQDDVIRALTEKGGWRMTLSDDPREALPLLRRILDEG
jgi:hypothetical protein